MCRGFNGSDNILRAKINTSNNSFSGSDNILRDNVSIGCQGFNGSDSILRDKNNRRCNGFSGSDSARSDNMGRRCLGGCAVRRARTRTGVGQDLAEGFPGLCSGHGAQTQTGRCFVNPVWEAPEASVCHTEQQREVDKARWAGQWAACGLRGGYAGNLQGWGDPPRPIQAWGMLQA